MKLIPTLSLIALSASLAACIIAPPRPYLPLVSVVAPIAVTPVAPASIASATVYYEPNSVAPAVHVWPYIGLGWWIGRHWGGNHNGHRH